MTPPLGGLDEAWLPPSCSSCKQLGDRPAYRASMRKTRTNNGPAITHNRTGPSPHPSRDSCHYLIIASDQACPTADPLAVDMDPYHHQFSCVDDRPTCYQCGASDRKQNGVAQC